MRHFAPELILSLLTLVALGPVAAGQDKSDEANKATAASLVRRFESQHEVQIDGHALRYAVTAEDTLLRDDKGATRAAFFTFTYTLPDADPRQRPVTFAFNGGPGSSSIWLHLGLLAPVRAKVPSDAQHAGVPPYELEPNPATLLTVSDIVFVDPIGTGFSTARGEAKNEDYWGVDEDARSVADFVRQWLSDHQRWSSPKYVLGESYGGIRGPLVLRNLQGRGAACELNGVMFVSPAFDLQMVDGSGSDMGYALLLPTLAATAAYHHALPEQPVDLEAFLQEARTFSGGEYLAALFAGASMDEARAAAIAAKLHHFTGLSVDYIERAHLRISAARFRRELLRSRGLVVGRLDARYTGTEADDDGEVPTSDPMSTGVGGAYVATFLDYIARELHVDLKESYAVSASGAGRAWKRAGGENNRSDAFGGWLDVVPQLQRGMAENPALRVFVASGLYDTATTFFAAEYQVRRPGIDLQRVTQRNYPAGHMMYLHEPSLVRLGADLRAFVAH